MRKPLTKDEKMALLILVFAVFFIFILMHEPDYCAELKDWATENRERSTIVAHNVQFMTQAECNLYLSYRKHLLK